MTETELEDARRFWLCVYAQDTFKKVSETCNHILKHGLDTDSPIYYPL